MVLCAIITSSCTRRLTDFTIISTKNVPVDNATFVKGDERVKGVDVGHTVLIIPGTPNMKEAIDKAIQSVPGAVGLVDGVIKASSWTCFFYGQNKFIVEGTPLFPVDGPVYNENTGKTKAKKSKSNYDNEDYYIETADDEGSNRRSISGRMTSFSHQVKVGETLASIAKLYDVKVHDIIKWNRLKSSKINPGQNLTIRIVE